MNDGYRVILKELRFHNINVLCTAQYFVYAFNYFLFDPSRYMSLFNFPHFPYSHTLLIDIGDHWLWTVSFQRKRVKRPSPAVTIPSWVIGVLTPPILTRIAFNRIKWEKRRAILNITIIFLILFTDFDWRVWIFDAVEENARIMLHKSLNAFYSTEILFLKPILEHSYLSKNCWQLIH